MPRAHLGRSGAASAEFIAPGMAPRDPGRPVGLADNAHDEARPVPGGQDGGTGSAMRRAWMEESSAQPSPCRQQPPGAARCSWTWNCRWTCRRLPGPTPPSGNHGKRTHRPSRSQGPEITPAADLDRRAAPYPVNWGGEVAPRSRKVTAIIFSRGGAGTPDSHREPRAAEHRAMRVTT